MLGFRNSTSFKNIYVLLFWHHAAYYTHSPHYLSPPGSWDCTPRLSWSLASLSESFSAAFPTPSCSRSCPTWIASSSCVQTSSWSGRQESWTWRRKCTPNLSSCTALQRPWSSGPGRKLSEEGGGATIANEEGGVAPSDKVLSVWAAVLSVHINQAVGKHLLDV